MRIASVIGPITAQSPAGAAPQAMWPGYFDSKSVLFSWWPPNTQTAWADAAFTGSISGNVLTVTAVATPSVWPGLVLNPSGLTVTDWNFTNSAHSGAGGTGTYGLSGTGSEPAGTAFTGSSNAPQYYKVYKNGTLICGGTTNTTGLTNPGVTPSAVPGNILSGFALNHPFPWYVDNNVTPGVAATYTVTAFQNGQESPAGPSLTMTPLANGPSASPAPVVEPSTWIQPLQIPAVAPIVCNTQADLENAFNLVAVGGVTATLAGPNLIVLTAGNSFTIPNANGWTPPIFTGTGWTYIISSQTPEYTAGGKLPAYNGSVSLQAPIGLSCTSTIAAGATSATLAASQGAYTDSSGNWLLKSGWYYVHFYEPTLNSVGWGGLTEERLCVFTQGSPTFTWNLNNGHYASPGLSAQATAWGQTSGNAQVAVCYLTGVTPYDSKTNAAMATFNMNSLVNSSCLTLQPGTTKVRFIGIEFTNTGTGALSSTTEGTAYIHFTNSQPPPAGTLPGRATITTPSESIYFDRCLIGAPTDASNYQYVPHGISFVNCNHLLVNQCYTYGVAYNFYGAGAAGGGPGSGDANCYALNGNNHAWLNSYFQCVAESLLYGGGYVDPVNLPTNITFRGNMSHKPLSWLAGANTGIASWTLNGVNQSSSEGANGAVLSTPWPFVTQTVSADFDPITGGNGVVTVTVTNGQTAVSFGSTLSATQNFQSWMHVRGGTGYGMFGRETKNLFELKVGFTVDVSNNLFLNNWTANAAGYHGAPVALGARDQQAILYSQATMASPWNAVTDVNVYNNLMYNIETPFVSFTSDSSPTCYDQRCRLYNNLIFVNSPKTGAERFTGIRLQNPVPDHILDHNTMVLNTNLAGASAQGAPICVSLVSVGTGTPGYFGDPVPYGPNPTTLEDDRLTITNNIFWSGGNTWTFNSLSPTPVLGSAWPNLTWSNNLTLNDTSAYAGVPAANQNVAVGNIGFQNYQGNQAFPLHPSDWNVVGTQYATASTTGGPLGFVAVSTPSALPANPIGMNISLSSAGTGLLEGFALSQDRIPESQFNAFQSGSQSATLGTDGWPNEDYTCLLYDGANSQGWLQAGTGKFACGFTGTGTVTAWGGCAVSNIVSAGGIVTFDLQVNSGYSGGVMGFSVSGTGGANKKIFAFLPAYRQTGYLGDGVYKFTTEAVAHHSQFRHLRSMFGQNSWYNMGYLLNCSSVGSGATSCTITGAASNVGYVPTSGSFTAIFKGSVGTSPDVRTVTISGTTATFAALTQNATGFFIPCSSQTRRTPANTKFFCWNAAEWDGEGMPVEYFIAFAKACGNTAYIMLPNNADATYDTAAATAAYPNPVMPESGNENWNGGYFNGASASMQALSNFTGHGSNYYDFMATRLHQAAVAFQTAYGASFDAKVQFVYAWQNSNLAHPYGFFNDYQTLNGVTPAQDGIEWYAVAPYINLSSPVSTWSVAQIEANLLNFGGFGGSPENLFILARHFGAGMGSYEGGWQVNNEPAGTTNIPAAIMDNGTSPGMKSVMQQYYNKAFNAGWTMFTQFESGVGTATIAPTAYNPGDQLDSSWADLIATPTGSPRFAAIQSYASGLPVPTRNVISGSGSVIQGGNYADHVGAANPALGPSSTGAAPYVNNSGRVSWVLQVTDPRAVSGPVSYSVVIGISGSGTTDVEVDGNVLFTNVSVSNGSTLGTISLSAGPHYICLGRTNVTQTPTVATLTFN